MTLGGLSLGIRETFAPQLPPGVEFFPPDGMLFRLARTPAGMRYVCYLVKIEGVTLKGVPLEEGARVFYQGISIRMSELASIDLVVGKVTEAITKFRQALLAGTARSTEDGGLMELDPEEGVHREDCDMGDDCTCGARK